MKVLVVVASKHGSTRDIAEAIGEDLRGEGHVVDVFEAGNAPDPEAYDAAVVGSAIYVGRWMGEAQQYVERYAETLRTLPVWLFSSGPLGEDYPEGMGRPENLEALITLTGARDHEVFVGRLDKSDLGIGERLITKAVKAPEGDFRDWEAIGAWAREIAVGLG